MFSLKKPRPQFWVFFFGAILVIIGAYILIKFAPWWLAMLLPLGGFIGLLIWNWKRFEKWQRLAYLIMIVGLIALTIDRWIENQP